MSFNNVHENVILEGDCREVLKILPENSIDLIVTDPPYNLDKDFENDNLTEAEFITFLTPILTEMGRVIKPKRSIIVFFDSGQKLPLFFKSLFGSGLFFQKGGNYYKPNDCSMPHNRILRTSEVFYVLACTRELHHEGEKYIHDCLIGNHRKKEKWYHPTAKNKKVVRELVLSHSVRGELVLDPFAGSGTTCVAAKETGRKYIGIEIEERYVNIANQRIGAVALPLEAFA